MPLYFFHLRDADQELLDPEGREILRESDVAHRAIQDARFLISQEALEGRIDMAQRIEVEDGEGRIVLTVSFADAVTVVGID